MPFDVSLGAMRALADDLRRITADCTERGHPIDLARVLDPEFLRAAAAVSQRRALPSPIPKLCTLVVSSPFDAALHDAYGKVFGVSAYATYGARLHERRSVPGSRLAVQGRVPGSLHSVQTAADDAGVSFGRARAIRSSRRT